MEDKTFKDLTKHSVISIPEEAGEFSSGEYKVYGVGKGTYNNPEELTIALLYEDEYGDCIPYLEILTESEFLEGECTIVSIPDEKTQETIKSLDSLITSIEKQAEEIKSKAKESGLDYDVVVLSSPDDLGVWYSSRC